MTRNIAWFPLPPTKLFPIQPYLLMRDSTCAKLQLSMYCRYELESPLALVFWSLSQIVASSFFISVILILYFIIFFVLLFFFNYFFLFDSVFFIVSMFNYL